MLGKWVASELMYLPRQIDRRCSPATTALAESLKRDGFCNGTVHGATEGQKFPNRDAIHLVIGKKPP